LAKHFVATMTFDDLSPGDEWESPARTVTEADVVAFAGLSGDYNPIHVDHESAKSGAFGHPIAHGLLGLAFVSGLGSSAPRVDTLAFLAILEWEFLRPIAFGDTVHVVSRVESVTPRSRGRRAEVIWARTLVNQRGEAVQQGRTRTLVRGRAGLAATQGGASTEA
jgi:3-hydroxybutyryl-CoA dehydratase